MTLNKGQGHQKWHILVVLIGGFSKSEGSGSHRLQKTPIFQVFHLIPSNFPLSLRNVASIMTDQSPTFKVLDMSGGLARQPNADHDTGSHF